VLKLIANSKTNDINLQYHGRYIAYFPTGKKMKSGEFEYGVPVGHQVSYYPGGKFYNSLNYFPDGKVLYNELRDSTGKVLAENGTGDWIEFDTAFKDNLASGKVDSGYRVGIWNIKLNDSVSKHEEYVKGELKSTQYFYKSRDTAFTKADVVPEFPGGMEAFLKFLVKVMRYPAAARERGVQGRVLVSFVVERDGSLTDIKVARGIGSGCDEEAVRVMKLSPKWIPGSQNGNPVRVAYTMPLSYALSND